MSSSAPPPASESRAIRVDLIIAVCALLISSLATAASWWQSRVVATQLSSQVWPYVSITSTIGPDGLELAIANDGLGPAVVRSLVLTVDGAPYPTLREAARALAGAAAPPPSGSFASLSPGSVIRPGAAVRLINIQNLTLVRKIARQTARVDLRVCYCSILGDCWLRTIQRDEPQRLSACPYDRATNYRGLGAGA